MHLARFSVAVWGSDGKLLLLLCYYNTNINMAENKKEIIASENLKADETAKFVENAFRDGTIRTTGTDIDKILPAMSRFGGGNRQEKKKNVIEKLKVFFEKYFGV